MLGTPPRPGTGTALRAGLAAIAAAAVLTACSGGGSGPTAAPSAPPPATSGSSSSAPGGATGNAASSAFCTQAQSFAASASEVLTAGTSTPNIDQRLEALATRARSITPPPAIAADWQSLLTTLEQVARAYRGVDLSNAAQVQTLRQELVPLTQQLTTSGRNLEQYLHGECGDSSGDPSGTVAPSS